MSQFPQAFTRRQTDARQDDRRETDADARQIDADRYKTTDARQTQDRCRRTDARQDDRRETDADADARIRNP